MKRKQTQTAAERWASVKSHAVVALKHATAVVKATCTAYSSVSGQYVSPTAVFVEACSRTPTKLANTSGHKWATDLDEKPVHRHFMDWQHFHFHLASPISMGEHWSNTASEWEAAAAEWAELTPEAANAALRRLVEPTL